MLAIIEFVFSSFWVWLGCFIAFCVFMGVINNIINLVIVSMCNDREDE